MPLYCHSIDNDKFVGKFNSLEEAQLACIVDNNLEKGDIYYIGEVKEYTPRDFISVFSLVDTMKGQAIFEVNEEAVGNWPDVSPSKYHELRELLIDFFDKNYPVDFFGVENVKSYLAGE